jgi:hypothetical protein
LDIEEGSEGVEEPTAEAPRKRGRPRKLVATEHLAETLADVRRTRQAKVRHDAEDAPIDGDYDPLKLANEDPDFRYFWASDKDRGRLGHRGWIEERWSPTCAHPKFYFGAKHRGELIKEKELTLMKMPTVDWERLQARDPQRRRHAQLMSEIMQPTKPGHTTTITERTVLV